MKILAVKNAISESCGFKQTKVLVKTVFTGDVATAYAVESFPSEKFLVREVSFVSNLRTSGFMNTQRSC